MKILCVGDIFGPKGVDVAVKCIKELKQSQKIDFIVVNIENSNVGGRGPSEYALRELSALGVHVFTGGNHSFDNYKTFHIYNDYQNLLRPYNFYAGAPGKGIFRTSLNGQEFVVINIQLRTFMREQLACPFQTIDLLLASVSPNAIVVVDLHGEATSEKLCFGNYCDGRASIVFGTHTHVQTADARVMPKGVGYITDIGMVGPLHSSIGKTFESVTRNLISQMPGKMDDEIEGEFVFSAAIFDVDAESKKCMGIEKIYWVE